MATHASKPTVQDLLPELPGQLALFEYDASQKEIVPVDTAQPDGARNILIKVSLGLYGGTLHISRAVARDGKWHRLGPRYGTLRVPDELTADESLAYLLNWALQQVYAD
jgi:hypothetical protein